jgi:general secretion pathway protein G
MKKLKNKKKILRGFTLIELLVAMTIIGLLAVIMLGGFRSSQRRSRDAARKSDLKQISSALEMYYSDHGTYPASYEGKIKACPSLPTPSVCSWGGDEMTDGKTIYFKSLPADPAGGSYYYRTLLDGQGYQLYAHLENLEDQNCVNSGCTGDGLPTGSSDCGGVCNFSITSTNVTPKQSD